METESDKRSDNKTLDKAGACSGYPTRTLYEITQIPMQFEHRMFRLQIFGKDVQSLC